MEVCPAAEVVGLAAVVVSPEPQSSAGIGKRHDLVLPPRAVAKVEEGARVRRRLGLDERGERDVRPPCLLCEINNVTDAVEVQRLAVLAHCAIVPRQQRVCLQVASPSHRRRGRRGLRGRSQAVEAAVGSSSTQLTLCRPRLVLERAGLARHTGRAGRAREPDVAHAPRQVGPHHRPDGGLRTRNADEAAVGVGAPLVLRAGVGGECRDDLEEVHTGIELVLAHPHPDVAPWSVERHDTPALGKRTTLREIPAPERNGLFSHKRTADGHLHALVAVLAVAAREVGDVLQTHHHPHVKKDVRDVVAAVSVCPGVRVHASRHSVDSCICCNPGVPGREPRSVDIRGNDACSGGGALVDISAHAVAKLAFVRPRRTRRTIPTGALEVDRTAAVRDSVAARWRGSASGGAWQTRGALRLVQVGSEGTRRAGGLAGHVFVCSRLARSTRGAVRAGIPTHAAAVVCDRRQFSARRGHGQGRTRDDGKERDDCEAAVDRPRRSGRWGRH
mmetsp:Transcript_62880/g.148017  ORF Transcript_62880/g.148017 Transcript_62880/m.148017 type:complete len:502 (-) Transcript_62880:531-2036(-)